MNERFIPLIIKAASADSAEPFRAKVLPGASSHAVPFHTATPAPAAASLTAHRHSNEPQITLTRDGDRITSIRVQCSCGEVMDLQCDY